MVQVSSQSTVNKIEMRLRGKGRGSIVFQQDYADCGTPSAVKSTFYPSVEDIAQAIAKRDKANIVPMGAYALNRLGLSTQMPMNVVFLTNGAPRRIKIGNGRGILFKHSSSGRNFAYKSELMMLAMPCYQNTNVSFFNGMT